MGFLDSAFIGIIAADIHGMRRDAMNKEHREFMREIDQINANLEESKQRYLESRLEDARESGVKYLSGPSESLEYEIESLEGHNKDLADILQKIEVVESGVSYGWTGRVTDFTEEVEQIFEEWNSDLYVPRWAVDPENADSIKRWKSHQNTLINNIKEFIAGDLAVIEVLNSRVAVVEEYMKTEKRLYNLSRAEDALKKLTAESTNPYDGDLKILEGIDRARIINESGEVKWKIKNGKETWL